MVFRSQQSVATDARLDHLVIQPKAINSKVSSSNGQEALPDAGIESLELAAGHSAEGEDGFQHDDAYHLATATTVQNHNKMLRSGHLQSPFSNRKDLTPAVSSTATSNEFSNSSAGPALVSSRAQADNGPALAKNPRSTALPDLSPPHILHDQGQGYSYLYSEPPSSVAGAHASTVQAGSTAMDGSAVDTGTNQTTFNS